MTHVGCSNRKAAPDRQILTRTPPQRALRWARPGSGRIPASDSEPQDRPLYPSRGDLGSPQTDPKITRRIHELIQDTTRHPFEGLGKPEPLRHALSGYWSRRITEVHRMVYRGVGQDLWIAQLRYHY